GTSRDSALLQSVKHASYARQETSMSRCIALRTRSAAGLLAVIVIGMGVAGTWQAAADDPGAEPKPDRVRDALHAAIEKNLAYCRDWLAAKDMKSLRQTADGLGILVQVVTQQRGDEGWRRAADGLATDVRSLRAAADGQRADEC